MRLRPVGASAEVELLRDIVGIEEPSWRQRDAPRLSDEDGDGDAAGPVPGDLSPEELEARRKHLKALGYVG